MRGSGEEGAQRSPGRSGHRKAIKINTLQNSITDMQNKAVLGAQNSSPERKGEAAGARGKIRHRFLLPWCNSGPAVGGEYSYFHHLTHQIFNARDREGPGVISCNLLLLPCLLGRPKHWPGCLLCLSDGSAQIGGQGFDWIPGDFCDTA